MSGRLLRLVCTAAVAAQAALVPLPAAAAPEPRRPVKDLLTDLHKLYRQAEQATETYNATDVKLRKQRSAVTRLDGALAQARLSLQESRGAAGRLARQQYQNTSDISAYVQLLLSRDPQHALDERHVIGELARERAETAARLAGGTKRADELARKARRALDTQLTLAARQKKNRDDVRARLTNVEQMLASLSAEQLTELARLEKNETAGAQNELLASGALGAERAPSQEGNRAVHYAEAQLGKPYQWGAEGPGSYDCSGLTSQAWNHAGTPIPRTSQEQWARLPKVSLKNLRPGDLVIYFPEATHVAMYVGEGTVIQAPRPGERIKLSPLASNPILGAVRPDQARPAAAAQGSA
ncbi:C40 family peptidase [Streptomyces brasiliensis]|uniref:NlpC/P60 domain-containing protein n=1 Tax=Streptomyces brasiliensis TaxID=1954 RepID=A0A917P592_9ACTN|nr:C40 family peptidase [Streptomyces brasiliensis]GGJ62189.1 hypothetical protein GCM10010121_086010 [Streptomyces brasiliensis]